LHKSIIGGLLNKRAIFNIRSFPNGSSLQGGSVKQ